MSTATLTAPEIALRRELDDLRRDLDAQRTLHAELLHRQANQLDLAYQLLTLRRAELPADAPARQPLAEAGAQLLAFRSVNRHLAPAAAEACLATILRDLCESVRAASPVDFALSLDLRPTAAAPRVVTRLALVVNELLTNSIKHGLTPGGTVTLSLKPAARRGGYRLDYGDSGPGEQATQHLQPESAGQGATLLRLLVADVGGTLHERMPGGAGYACAVTW